MDGLAIKFQDHQCIQIMKKLRRGQVVFISATILFIPIGLALYAWTHWSPAGAVIPAEQVADIKLDFLFRNSQQHDVARERNGGNPYILEIQPEGDGSLIYYGASHSADPEHPQISDITSRWLKFKPTVALYEGRSRGFFYGALIEPFAGLSEPALVHKLANQDRVPLHTLEPEYADEVAQLLKLFTAEQVGLYFFNRVYSSESGGNANEALALELLQKRTDVEGLRGVLSGVDDLDHVWQRDFPDESDWRVNRGEQGYLAEISVESRRIRGEHMVRILIHLVNQGHRVFAVVGSGHVIRQEWNLRAAFNQEPAWDQPVLLDVTN